MPPIGEVGDHVENIHQQVGTVQNEGDLLNSIFGIYVAHGVGRIAGVFLQEFSFVRGPILPMMCFPLIHDQKAQNGPLIGILFALRCRLPSTTAAHTTPC